MFQLQARNLFTTTAIAAALFMTIPAQAGERYTLPVTPASVTMAQPVAVETASARKFIDTMAGQAIEFLGHANMSQDAKQQQFEKLLRESFDMDTIGRFALGKYWRTATDAQRKEYLSLFRRMVVKVYSTRFSEYDGQKFETRAVRAEGEKDVLVTSFIVPGSGPEVQVDWRVRYKDGRWRIVDVIVEGVSMSVTQRSDFAAVIQRGGGDVGVLIQHLRSKG